MNLQNRNKVTDAENKLVVNDRGREGGAGCWADKLGGWD